MRKEIIESEPHVGQAIPLSDEICPAQIIWVSVLPGELSRYRTGGEIATDDIWMRCPCNEVSLFRNLQSSRAAAGGLTSKGGQSGIGVNHLTQCDTVTQRHTRRDSKSDHQRHLHLLSLPLSSTFSCKDFLFFCLFCKFSIHHCFSKVKLRMTWDCLSSYFHMELLFSTIYREEYNYRIRRILLL